MTDNLSTKCNTEDLSRFVAIKNYINYAKTVTKRLEFIGLRGDCGLSGKPELNDAMRLVNILAKKDVLTANLSYIGDMDASSSVPLNDAMAIIGIVAKK